jgi:hypothetical protein
MAEPNNIVLEHLRTIWRQVEEISSDIDSIADGVGRMADSTQLERIGLKLDGLTFILRSSFASMAQRLDSLDERLSQL